MLLRLLLLALLLASPAVQAASATDQAVELLCDKRIALLGELPSHGEARGFAGKAAVARALVGRCGFSAVLFEAPIYDFVALEPLLAQGKATPKQLDDAIGRFWSATDLSEWRAWLLQSAGQGRLRLGGLDDQASATSAWAQGNLPAMVAGHVAPDERADCKAAVARHLGWTYDDEQHFDDVAKRRLGRCAGAAAGHAVSAPGDDGHLLANFDGLVLREIGAMAAVDRDAAMQRNLVWYLRRLPAGSKVIVWTANVHAAKRAGGLSARPLGAWLAESFGEQMGSVAFTALAGKGSLPGKPAKALPPLGKDSLEAKALGARDEAFLDAPALRDLGTIQSRLYGTPAVNEWATRFDGVVVYRTEKPPTFAAPPAQ